MSLNLWPTEAKQLRKTKAENLKSALSTCPRWPFSARFFLHIFVVVVALLNLRPKDTISIWGACESLASAPRLHFISLSALWQGALISAWMQSKRFPFGPRERLPCMLTCLDLELAKRGTRQKTLPYIWLAGSPRMATGQPFQLD